MFMRTRIIFVYYYKILNNFLLFKTYIRIIQQAPLNDTAIAVVEVEVPEIVGGVFNYDSRIIS